MQRQARAAWAAGTTGFDAAMSTSSKDQRPMQQPGTHGADVGGISRNAEGGLEDAMDRMAERRDDDASGAASIGQGMGNGAEPRLDLGGHNEPGEAPASPRPPGQPATQDASPRRLEAEGRDAGVPLSPAGAAPAEPDAGVPPDQQMAAGSGPPEPPEEGPLESLGRSISEVIIGTLDEDADLEHDDETRAAPRPDEKP
jgi:hypothetical protein